MVLSSSEQIILNALTKLGDKKPSSEITEECLVRMIPRDSDGRLLHNYSVTELAGGTSFIPLLNKLVLSPKELLALSEKQASEIAECTFIETKYLNRFYNYFYFGVLFHELSHGKQFLIARKNYPYQYDAVKNVYKEMMGIMMLPKPLQIFSRANRQYDSYQKNYNYLIIERNAALDQFQSMRNISVADPNSSYAISTAIDYMHLAFLFMGYSIDSDGRLICPMEQSLTAINKQHVYQQLKFPEKCSALERMTYGMPLSKEVYEVLSEDVKKKVHPLAIRSKMKLL